MKLSPNQAQESLYASLRNSVNRGEVTDAQVQAYLSTFRKQAARPEANTEQTDHIVDLHEMVEDVAGRHNRINIMQDAPHANSHILTAVVDNAVPAAIWPREEE